MWAVPRLPLDADERVVPPSGAHAGGQVHVDTADGTGKRHDVVVAVIRRGVAAVEHVVPAAAPQEVAGGEGRLSLRCGIALTSQPVLAASTEELASTSALPAAVSRPGRTRTGCMAGRLSR